MASLYKTDFEILLFLYKNAQAFAWTLWILERFNWVRKKCVQSFFSLCNIKKLAGLENPPYDQVKDGGRTFYPDTFRT